MSEQSSNPALDPITTSADLASFYADRKLMWRNVRWITFGYFGMSLSMTIVEPLMNLRLKAMAWATQAWVF